MTMHKARKGVKHCCPTCGSHALQPCVFAKDFTDEIEVSIRKVDDIEWLEFQVLAALSDLKAAAPDHYLVTTINTALNARAYTGDKATPALARRQAD